jgi:ATP-dependent Lhr-like helicase
VEVEDGRIYRINSRRIAMRHRLHIGTIVSDAMLKVKFLSGGYVGIIEEWFISRLEPGDSFTLAGRQLELIMIKDMTVIVKKSTKKNPSCPAGWEADFHFCQPWKSAAAESLISRPAGPRIKLRNYSGNEK